jgi:hypothetical protein
VKNLSKETKEVIDRMAFQNFRVGMTFEKYKDKMNCPVCGSGLKIGGVDIYETLSEHVMCEDSVPRVCFVCDNDFCSVYGKGFWGEPIDGSFYSYSEGSEKLKGDPLGFGSNIPDLFTSKFRHEKFEYTSRGLYIGPNWKSKIAEKIYGIVGFIKAWWWEKFQKEKWKKKWGVKKVSQECSDG